MEWQESFTLDHQIMDETHKELITLINLLQTANDQEALKALQTVIRHSEVHFIQENRWMKESGFTAIDSHISEHNRVLESLNRMLRMLEEGTPNLGKVVANELSGWFNKHTSTMDSALVSHMRNVNYTPREFQDLSEKKPKI